MYVAGMPAAAAVSAFKIVTPAESVSVVTPPVLTNVTCWPFTGVAGKVRV